MRHDHRAVAIFFGSPPTNVNDYTMALYTDLPVARPSGAICTRLRLGHQLKESRLEREEKIINKRVEQQQ
jgi:hypothetical protein